MGITFAMCMARTVRRAIFLGGRFMFQLRVTFAGSCDEHVKHFLMFRRWPAIMSFDLGLVGGGWLRVLLFIILGFIPVTIFPDL